MKAMHTQKMKRVGGFELFTFLYSRRRKSSCARWLRAACAVFLLCGATVIASPAATKFKSLVSFDATDGEYPTLMSVVQGLDGNLYGTTQYGGTYSHGTVFKMTPGGKLTTLWNFCKVAGCPDGAQPEAGLTLATDGNFYGATNAGGAIGYGSIFKITPAGKLTTLFSFCQKNGCADGSGPSPLIQASDGNFYGTTMGGGAHQHGTIYELTPDGILTTLYNFCSQPSCADGQYPAAGLVQATNGNLYGTTADGGAHGDGTVFSIAP